VQRAFRIGGAPGVLSAIDEAGTSTGAL
jgi:hypothetical protein